MGTWSTSLSSNDLYADIYYEFFELYNDGYSVDEISEKIIRENTKIFDDFEEGYNCWLALAKAQWECKQLGDKVFEKVKQIIESGTDIEVWRRLGASDSDIKKRQAVLNKFLETLQSERPKAKTRQKKRVIIYEPAYDKGDCLTFKLSNGNYGGIIVLEAVNGSIRFNNNLFAETNINQVTEPTVNDFKKCKILMTKQQDFQLDKSTGKAVEVWHNRSQLCWCCAPKDPSIIKKVGSVKVTRTYDVDDYKSGIGYSSYLDGMIDGINYTFFKSKRDLPKPVPLKRFTCRQFFKRPVS
jgi:hypothetical protein